VNSAAYNNPTNSI